MTDQDLLTITISGKAMGTIEGSELWYNPEKYDGGTPGSRSAHDALHSAASTRRGKGYTHRVLVDRAGAEVIREYCWTVGQTFAGELEPDTRADGRALLTVAERINGLLA